MSVLHMVDLVIIVFHSYTKKQADLLGTTEDSLQSGLNAALAPAPSYSSEHTRLLTNDRTRFPYTYIGMDASQQTA